MEIELNIGNRIQEKRKEKKLTIKEIKEKTGLSMGTISEIENNNKIPSSKTILKLSEVLECSTDYLLTGKEYGEDKGQNKDSDIRANKLLTYFYAMNEEDKEDILFFAKHLAAKGGVTLSDLGEGQENNKVRA